MLSPKTVPFLMCLFLGAMAQATEVTSSSSAQPDGAFLYVQTGENLKLRCFYKVDFSARLYWYKRMLGQKPTLVSAFNAHDSSGTFYDEFETDGRFTLDTESGNYDLKISNTQLSDSALYYCISSGSRKVEFVEVISVIVSSSDVTVPALFLQSTSGSIQPGDSATLSCTVHTGTCDGEHSVYWFKHSEESHPGLIYTHGGRNDQCERKDNTQTHTCVYNLPLKDLDVSHAGTYYCAVASCGHILFGNEIKLDFKGEDKLNSLQLLVNVLSGALAFAGILVVFLTFSICKIRKENSCSEAQTVSSSATTHGEGTQDADSRHHAALKEHRPPRSTVQKGRANNECVYSSVKH